jgi:hypothetical protein
MKCCSYAYIHTHTHTHTCIQHLQDIEYDYEMLLKAAPGAPRVLNFEKKKEHSPATPSNTAKAGPLITDPHASDVVEESAKSVLARMDDGFFPLKGLFPDSRVFFVEESDDEWYEYDEGDESRVDYDQTQTQTRTDNGGSDAVNNQQNDDKKGQQQKSIASDDKKGEQQKSGASGLGKGGTTKKPDDDKKKKSWGGLLSGGQGKEDVKEGGHGLDVLDIGP